MPCSARMSLATPRISAWGTGEAATLRVVPASSLVSAAASLETASEEAASEEAAAEEEAVEPQAARLRASAPARTVESSFFMIHSPFVSKCSFPEFADRGSGGPFSGQRACGQLPLQRKKQDADGILLSVSQLRLRRARRNKHRMPQHTAHAHHHGTAAAILHGAFLLSSKVPNSHRFSRLNSMG